MIRQKQNMMRWGWVAACVGLAVWPAYAFRGEAGHDLLRAEPAVQQQAAEAAPVRTVQQLSAARAAAAAGVRVAWHERLGTPSSVRGADLGQRQAFSGGKGLRVQGGGAYQADAVAVLDGLAPLFRLADAGKEFAVRRTDADAMGFHHVRMNQVYHRLRVVGGELIVHFNRQDRAYEVNGQYVPDIDVDVTPAIDGEAAVRVAREELTGRGLPQGEPSKAPELVIYARGMAPRLAYELALTYPKAQGGVDVWRYWIDARQGTILVRFNDVKDIAAPASGAHATVSGNVLPREGGMVREVAGWLEDTGFYYLYNRVYRWRVRNAAPSGYSDADTYAFRSTADWADSDPAEMSAAVNVDVIQRYYWEVHGLNSYDGEGTIADAYVHQLEYGMPMANAYWDGTAMHIGDGDGVTADNLGVVDVFAHEYTHAVTEHACNLVYQNESGALNESFSDIFGACVEFYAQEDDRTNYPSANAGKADWLMGEDCWISSTALRDLQNPANPETVGEGGQQPTRYKGTYWYSGAGDRGGVHQNSGVMNFFFYLLCEGGSGVNDGTPYNVTGIGVTNAEHVAYRALSVYCTADTDFSTIRDAWVSAATDINPDWVRSVRKAWNAVLGVTPPVLFSPSLLPPARVGTPYSYTLGLAGGVAPFTWAIDGALPANLTFTDGVISGMPEEVATVTFAVEITDDDGQNATNQYSLSVLPAFTAPFAETFENSGALPDSWTQSSAGGEISWAFRDGSPQGHPAHAHGGSYNAFLGAERDGTYTAWLVSPRIDFGTDVHAARLTFWQCMEEWAGGQDELRVYYKTSWEAEWALLATYSSSVLAWTQRTIDLPDPNQTYYIAFEGTAKYGYGVCIDDVQIWDPTPPLSMTTASSLPQALKDEWYEQTLAAEGGVAPYTFAVVSNAPPLGMTLNADGFLSGSASETQTAVFEVELTDSTGDKVRRTFILDVVLPRADLFAEDFENGGYMPAGWSQEYVTNNATWSFQNGGKLLTGETAGHPAAAASGGYNAFLWSDGDWFNGQTFDHRTRLVSPSINLGQAPASIRLTFWHCMMNWEGGQDELRVFYRTSLSNAWIQLAAYTTEVPSWTQRSILLPNPTSTYYLAFEGNAKFGYGVCVDDIRINDATEAPIITTPQSLPNGLAEVPYSQTLAAVGGMTPYAWEVVSNTLPASLTLDSASGVISGTPDVASTTYFRIRVVGANGLASTNLFSLKVTAVRPIPFSEPFENGGAIPYGWTQEYVSGSVNWTFRSGGGMAGHPLSAHGGTYNACFYFADNVVSKVTRLISPRINLGAGTPNTRLTFWHYMEDYGGDQDELRVYYRTNSLAPWNFLAAYTANTPAWTQRTVALPEPTGSYYIMFEGKARWGYGACIDDVYVTGDVSPYQTWRDSHFSSEDLEDVLISGDLADPDGDGIQNGLEYAMGLDPRVADTTGFPVGGVFADYLNYSYRESKAATDVTFVVEACTSLILQDWSSIGVSEILRSDSNTWWQVTTQYDVPVSSAPQRFMRLKVYLP